MYSQAIETQAIGFYRKKKHHYSPASNVPAGCIFLLFLKFGPIGFTDACMVDSATFLRFSHENRRHLFVHSPKEKNHYKWKTFTRGWGGTPLFKLYRCLPPHRVGFLRRFGLKTGTHFAHFGLESGMVFEGTTGVYERIYRFNSK